ncbi:hypothetical protein [Roseofilum capinflatum]|uniref:PEP-CTERM sorting domain-containing protein n=1 Tax=Roseofilum capinflatum BLCC-M114 TaxID=3022440 RepID=A0ABT7B6P1_9CYAN|nr:hypothetical protein [Roseofilum capinflatum]MDJ1174839.1 hypothetical protein [Roseofilum capinflatum BLCC-M114]
MPYSFWIEETDYTATGQYEFFQQSSGYLQIQDTSNPGSETIELPFLWWFSNYSYYYNPWFYWWVPSYNPSLVSNNYWLSNYSFISYNPSSNYGVQDFYYLVVPQTATSYFSNPNFQSAELDEFDPTVTLSSWEALLSDNYQITDINETELGICDLADCPTAAPVPEASSVIGVLAIGFAIIGIAIKRKFFPKQNTLISPRAKTS